MNIDYENIIERAKCRELGLSHVWKFNKFNRMKNPITQQPVSRTLHRDNVKPEDIQGANVLEGESNEYITQYDNGLMVRELKDNADNPYIKKHVES